MGSGNKGWFASVRERIVEAHERIDNLAQTIRDFDARLALIDLKLPPVDPANAPSLPLIESDPETAATEQEQNDTSRS